MDAILAVWRLPDGMVVTLPPATISSGKLLGFVRGEWSGAVGVEPFMMKEIHSNSTDNTATIVYYFQEP
jgi:hypothetical protein